MQAIVHTQVLASDGSKMQAGIFAVDTTTRSVSQERTHHHSIQFFICLVDAEVNTKQLAKFIAIY